MRPHSGAMNFPTCCGHEDVIFAKALPILDRFCEDMTRGVYTRRWVGSALELLTHLPGANVSRNSYTRAKKNERERSSRPKISREGKKGKKLQRQQSLTFCEYLHLEVHNTDFAPCRILKYNSIMIVTLICKCYTSIDRVRLTENTSTSPGGFPYCPQISRDR